MGLAGDVGADRLLAPHVVGLPCSWTHSTDASQSLMARYSFSSGRFASQPRPAADEIKPMAEPRGSMPPASRRSMRCRWPMKLILSMPGVPSATPAQENSAWTGPPHSSTAASMDALSARLTWMALTPGRVTSAKSMTTTSAPGVLGELGGRGAHAGRTTDDEDSLAVVPKCVEERHVIFSSEVGMVIRRRRRGP